MRSYAGDHSHQTGDATQSASYFVGSDVRASVIEWPAKQRSVCRKSQWGLNFVNERDLPQSASSFPETDDQAYGLDCRFPEHSKQHTECAG